MIEESYFENFPEFQTDRLILRKLEIGDAAAMQQIRSNEEVMIFMDSERHTTPEYSKNFIETNLKMYSEKKGLFWAIIHRSTHQFIGDFAYWQIDYKNSRAEIGYTLHPEFWGKGLMKEAMSQLLNFGFKNLNLHSIEANINPQNSRFEKNFKKDSALRKKPILERTIIMMENI